MSAPSSRSISPSNIDESRVRALLAQEKWRQARDELKVLAKADRTRFLPLLIEANVGLARKMIANGQVTEARQVATYLATIAPAAQLRALELELALSSGTADAATPMLISALAEAGAPLADAERVRMADAIVLSFSSPLESGSSRPAEQQLLDEIRAVRDGLEAVSRSDWQKIPDLLRRVPHRSVLGHWAIFVKGLLAFHTGENERAVKLWRSLPPSSVPAKASQPYLLLAVRRTGPSEAVPPAVLESFCCLAGLSAVTNTLIRAEALWNKDKSVESYRAVREGIANFPSRKLDSLGTLTDFYFKTPYGLSEMRRQSLLAFFGDLIRQNRPKNEVEVILAYRALALAGKEVAPPAELREMWESFLIKRQSLYGGNALLTSLAYSWLGDQLASIRPAPGYGRASSRMRDAIGAVEALKTSIDSDPGNLAAHLQLCTVYDTLKKSSERNRLLDKMTVRFPHDPKVLVAAARGCLERKAYTKGLEYLDRARQQDQLDPTIPKLTVVGLQDLARDQFRRKIQDKARQTIGRAEQWLFDSGDDFQRSRWSAYARQSAMEQLWGDATRAETLLARSLENAPGARLPLLLAHLEFRSDTRKGPSESPYWPKFRTSLREKIRLNELGLLMRLLGDWRTTDANLRSLEEERLLANALTEAAGRPFTRVEAVEVIAPWFQIPAYNDPELVAPIRLLIGKILHDDPLDPQFRVWQYRIDPDKRFEAREDRAKVDSIVQEAARRHDESALRQAQQILRSLDEGWGRGPIGSGFDEANEDEDDEDEEESEDEVFADGSAKNLQFLEQIMETLRTASVEVIRELRKKMSREIPPVLFDSLVELAKKGILPPSPLPNPLKPKRPPPAEGQIDLF